ncbi:alpha/beta fold hydrolase [Actinomadura montaniterrae]|uniref:Alpha/beta fold hydrolase n=2 Tax=Actinomadura montaniterrae TaxID=1803903 RepID=A0A6L3VR84_9ACTN|nr:alpha/beta fold hydrolase [Actinomadura montaniterrae]
MEATMGFSSFRRALGICLAALVAVPVLQAAPASAASSSGFNDYDCRPSAAHPNPVVLLHGLGGNGPGNFLTLGPALAAAGYCVYAETYGEALPPIPVGGFQPIDASAREVSALIDKVLTRTGASKVDLIGHSEGGFLSLYIPKFVPGKAARIDRVVAIAPPTHGTSFAGLVAIARGLGIMDQVNQVMATAGCKACTELTTDAPTVAKLDSGPITRPGVTYTVIASTSDVLVTPKGVSFVDEPGVTNTYVQDHCPNDPVGHIGLAYDTTVADLVTNAIDPAHPRPVTCGTGLPF